MKKLNQKGFSAIEGLLVIIIVILVVFVGYYIYHAQKNTNKTYSAAAKVSQSTPAKTSKKLSTGEPTVGTSISANSGLFKMANLGVEFQLPSSLDGFIYTPITFTDGGQGAYITTTRIENMINKCQPNSTSAEPDSYTIDSIGKLSGQYKSGQLGEAKVLKQFSSFYLSISAPNGTNPCYPNQAAMSDYTSQANAASAAFISAFQSSAKVIQ